jgi:hypothetical protein
VVAMPWLARARPFVFTSTGMTVFDKHLIVVGHLRPDERDCLVVSRVPSPQKMPLNEWHWVCEVLISCVRRTTPYL